MPRTNVWTVPILTAALATGCASAPAEPPSQQPAAESTAVPAATEPAAAEPEVYKNTVRWTTASEVDNFGFDVYRGESEEGPFVRLTEDPIPGAGTVDTPSKYEFVDDTIDPYKAYWYYVESISIHGEREDFTPVFRAKPKLEREPEGEAD